MDEDIDLNDLDLDYLDYVDIPEDELSEDEAEGANETEGMHLNQVHRLSLECRGENSHRINYLYMIVYWI